jgi:hypothetical protein
MRGERTSFEGEVDVVAGGLKLLSEEIFMANSWRDGRKARGVTATTPGEF